MIINRLIILLFCFCACSKESYVNKIEHRDWRLDYVNRSNNDTTYFQPNIFIGLSFLDDEQVLLTSRNIELLKLEDDSLVFSKLDTLYKLKVQLEETAISVINDADTLKYIPLKSSAQNSVKNIFVSGTRTYQDKIVEYKIDLNKEGMADFLFSETHFETGREDSTKQEIRIDDQINSKIFDVASKIKLPIEPDTSTYIHHPDYKFMQLRLENDEVYEVSYYNLSDPYALWLDELVVSVILNHQALAF